MVRGAGVVWRHQRVLAVGRCSRVCIMLPSQWNRGAAASHVRRAAQSFSTLLLPCSQFIGYANPSPATTLPVAAAPQRRATRALHPVHRHLVRQPAQAMCRPHGRERCTPTHPVPAHRHMPCPVPAQPQLSPVDLERARHGRCCRPGCASSSRARVHRATRGLRRCTRQDGAQRHAPHPSRTHPVSSWWYRCAVQRHRPQRVPPSPPRSRTRAP